MRRLKILHRTYYNFTNPVRLGPHYLLLRPRENHELRIESFQLETTPGNSIRWHRDANDNSVATVSFTEPASQLMIASETVIQHYGGSPVDFRVADHAVDYPFVYEAGEAMILRPYLICSEPVDDGVLSSWVAQFWQTGQSIQTYALLARLCAGINQSLSYQIREEPGVQPVAETLAKGTGSCRDFAHLFVDAARLLGIAARFVSGYLNAPPSDTHYGATHAWAEVFLPGAGWKGFDPTLGLLTDSNHIAVAVSRQSDAVPPISGTFFGSAQSSLDVGVWITET